MPKKGDVNAEGRTWYGNEWCTPARMASIKKRHASQPRGRKSSGKSGKSGMRIPYSKLQTTNEWTAIHASSSIQESCDAFVKQFPPVRPAPGCSDADRRGWCEFNQIFKALQAEPKLVSLVVIDEEKGKKHQRDSKGSWSLSAHNAGTDSEVLTVETDRTTKRPVSRKEHWQFVDKLQSYADKGFLIVVQGIQGVVSRVKVRGGCSTTQGLS